MREPPCPPLEGHKVYFVDKGCLQTTAVLCSQPSAAGPLGHRARIRVCCDHVLLRRSNAMKANMWVSFVILTRTCLQPTSVHCPKPSAAGPLGHRGGIQVCCDHVALKQSQAMEIKNAGVLTASVVRSICGCPLCAHILCAPTTASRSHSSGPQKPPTSSKSQARQKAVG